MNSKEGIIASALHFKLNQMIILPIILLLIHTATITLLLLGIDECYDTTYNGNHNVYIVMLVLQILNVGIIAAWIANNI